MSACCSGKGMVGYDCQTAGVLAFIVGGGGGVTMRVGLLHRAQHHARADRRRAPSRSRAGTPERSRRASKRDTLASVHARMHARTTTIVHRHAEISSPPPHRAASACTCRRRHACACASDRVRACCVMRACVHVKRQVSGATADTCCPQCACTGARWGARERLGTVVRVVIRAVGEDDRTRVASRCRRSFPCTGLRTLRRCWR